MSPRRLPILALSFLPFVAGPALRAGEPWADPRLTVTNGLAAWIDVSRQDAARGAAGLTPLRSWNDFPDVLFDGSGNHRDFSQPVHAFRPSYRQEFNGALVAFDGTNDFLRSAQPGREVAAGTLFVVCQPQAVTPFAGPVAAAARGRNDYLTGFNLDFGGQPAGALGRVNAEGAGFGGERDLLSPGGSPEPLGRWHRLTLVVGSDSAALRLDGKPRGSRPRTAGTAMRLDEFVLGARFYSNDANRPNVQGFFRGGLAEMLWFDRALSPAETEAVEDYLGRKYGALLRGVADVPSAEGAVPLTPVPNPPPVRVFTPGFETTRLPVRLNNVNNVRQRPDGSLLAVGYDGRVWLLTDTDGDGLEDRVSPFWDRQTFRAPIGAALTPPGYAAGDGVFIAAKDRVVLLLDKDRDGKADEDRTVATWTERSEQQGVDALGVAVAPDGSVYFSLGAASFTEPFLVDRNTGVARYSTRMDRGTIQRILPDLSRRETVCTGIRFAVGLAFNAAGDLFATDQEGATWRHDGNPLDELLHIRPGLHYGFPPRHPRHLPDVVDEPSTFDYAPQHQSTCGLTFNEPVNGGPPFGPPHWRGDAIVSGYSRGKLWRTHLVKGAAGYVARTDLLATFQSLVIDSCVTARGDLVVATHGGQPDWGSGPGGEGTLWRIRWKDRGTPQPTAAWRSGPDTLEVAFDRPLDPGSVQGLAGRAVLESGPHVAPGDRFETIRPGYQIVYEQLAAERQRHGILGLQLDPTRRQLTVRTRPRTAAVPEALSLPAAGPNPDAADSGIDLGIPPGGVEARWTSLDGKDSWVGWLPHADPKTAREFTRGSVAHEGLFERLKRPGTLELHGRLDLANLLQPAIQPGSAIDWERPAESVRVRFESDVPLEGDGAATSSREGGRFRRELDFGSPGRSRPEFRVRLATGGANVPDLVPTWSTGLQPDRWRPFPVRRFLPHWVGDADTSGIAAKPDGGGRRTDPEITGGNWLHGRRLFLSDRLACARCHVVDGEGAKVGPDLSNLVHRDTASVRKDIRFPNAALNPDHLASRIDLRDGTSRQGIVQREADGVLHVVTAGGAVERIARTEVASVTPSPVSLMPEGLWEAMSETERRDLLTFLLTRPLETPAVPPEVQGQKRPAVRAATDWQALVPDPAKAPTNPPPIRIVLCASPKDAGHGAPGFHDYPLWRDRWSALLGLADGVSVEAADRWPTAEQWAKADVIAFYHDNPAWVAGKSADLDAFLARGGGLVFLHWSMNAYRDLEPLKARLGRAWGAGGKFRYGPEALTLAPHALTAGLPGRLELTDEAYWNLPGADAGSTVLASSVEEGAPTPQVWIRESGKGRIFVCIPGHFTWTFDDPLYRTLLLRGLAWAGHQAPDRFLELVPVGARTRE